MCSIRRLPSATSDGAQARPLARDCAGPASGCARRVERRRAAAHHAGHALLPGASRRRRARRRPARRAPRASGLLAALLLGAADQLVFETETVRRYFSRFARFRRPAMLVQNGVDTQRFRPATAEERRAHRLRLGVPPDKPLLLFLGRFVEKKGLPVLRELAQRVPHAHWLFAGWGPLDPASWRLPNAAVVHSPATEELSP